MMAWDNGGIEPVYLCDSHADQLGESVKNYELSVAATGRLLANKLLNGKSHQITGNGQSQTRDVAAAKPQSTPPSGPPAYSSPALAKVDVQIVARPDPQPSTPIVAPPPVQTVAQLALTNPNSSVTATVPVSGSTSGEPAKTLVNEANANTVHGEAEAYRPALNGTPDKAEEAKPSISAEPARLCRSHTGERCTCEATVHCPTCGAWFCDAHGDDEQWHPCLLTM
jgi:hypothetical protein